MKKLLILMLILLSSFLLVGCGSNTNLENDEKDSSSKTKEKKSKEEDGKYIKKLSCSISNSNNEYDSYAVMIVDFDDNDMETSEYVSFQYTIHEDIYNQQEDKEKFMEESAKFLKKNVINSMYEEFGDNGKTTDLETSISGRNIYFSFSIEYAENKKSTYDESVKLFEDDEEYTCRTEYANVG